MLHDFFRHHQLRGNIQGDPTLAIERAKKRDVHRETIPSEDRAKLLAANDDLRDRVALRLLLDYGIRKGSLQGIQYRHFDHQRRRLILVVAKGGKVRELPIPDKDFWLDLERLILDVEAQPHHYLLCGQKTIPFGVPDESGRRQVKLNRFPEKPMSAHGAHDWWYRCQERAGLVAAGQTSGAKMHRTRHTAGQRVLDATGNLKAVQALLGHTHRSARPPTPTPTGTSSSWRHRCFRPSPRKRRNDPLRNHSPPSQHVFPANRDFMEAAGIEPASTDAPGRASTSVVRALLSPVGRLADCLPPG
jgi:integrase